MEILTMGVTEDRHSAGARVLDKSLDHSDFISCLCLPYFPICI